MEGTILAALASWLGVPIRIAAVELEVVVAHPAADVFQAGV